MSKKLQLRGGTTSEHSTFTGAVREVTVDTDKDTLVIHDGATAGGFTLPRTKAEVDALGIAATSVTGSQASAISANTSKVTNYNQTKSDIEALGIAASSITGALPAISGAALTNLPIPVSGTADFVASGTLPDGVTVVLKADGTVSASRELVAHSQSIPKGSETTIATMADSYTPSTTSVAFDPTTPGRFIMSYTPWTASDTVLIIGQVSGSTITFGNSFQGDLSPVGQISFDSSGVFIVLKDSNMVASGTITNNTIVLNTAVALPTGMAVANFEFDPSVAGRFVMVASKNISTNNYELYVFAGDLSGTSINFHTPLLVKASLHYQASLVNLSFDHKVPGRFAMVCRNIVISSGTWGIEVWSFTTTGNVITVGPQKRIDVVGGSTDTAIAFDPNTAGRFLVSHAQQSTGNGVIHLGTITGSNVITLSSLVAYTANYSAYVRSINLAFHKDVPDKCILSYVTSSYSNYLLCRVVTTSGSTPSVGSIIVLNSSYTGSSALAADPLDPGSLVEVYSESGNPSSVRTRLLQLPATKIVDNLTSTNFLGTSTAAYTDGQTATVMLGGGISTNQTGLTTGTGYYVQTDGTLATTADSISVFAGKALSTTSLQLDGPEAEPAAVSGTADFVATGTLPNGKPVVLKADGTIEVVSGSAYTQAIPAGTALQHKASYTTNPLVAFDPNDSNKFVLVYGQPGIAVVGTISAGAITFGTAVQFNNHTQKIGLAFDPTTAGRFAITFINGQNGNHGSAVIGTISGTSLTFGATAVHTAGECGTSSVAFDPNNAGSLVVAVGRQYDGDKGSAIAGTISGTTITFGTPVIFKANYTTHHYIAFDKHTAGKCIISFYDSANSGYGSLVVGTVSGTAVSFGGSVYVYSSTTSTHFGGIEFDSHNSGKFLVTTRRLVTAGQRSGNAVTLGSPVDFTSGSSEGDITIDPLVANKFLVAYTAGSVLKFKEGSINGTVITYGSEINTGLATVASYAYISVDYDSTAPGLFVVSYNDGSSYGTVFAGQLEIIDTNLTSSNFLGTSQADYTNGQTASIMLQGGVSTNQTGLTINGTYYTQANGTFATTSGAGTQIAGKALSATSILLKGI